MSEETDYSPYLYAADVHNIANGQGSAYEPDSVIGSAAKFTMSAVVRGITSAYNTLPGAYNFVAETVGASSRADYANTYNAIKYLDDDLARYYNNNSESIDVVGDIAASFVPGMAGIKALNYSQKALAGMNRGNIGRNMANSIGVLPTKSAEYAEKAAASLAENTYTRINKDVVKSFAAGFGQAGLEGAAFSIAAAAAMKDYSPLFEDQTASDIVLNGLIGGGAIGAGIMGSITAAQTWGKIRTATRAFEIKSNPIRVLTEVPDGVPTYGKILNRVIDSNKSKTIEVPVGLERTASRKEMNLDVALRSEITPLAHNADPVIADSLHSMIKTMDNQKAMQSLVHLNAVGRIGDELDIEKAIKAADEIGMPTNASIKYTSILGEDAGQTFHNEPNVTYFADHTADTKGIQAKVDKYKFFTEQNTSPLKATDHWETEARNIWARTLTEPNIRSAIIGVDDIAILDQAARLGMDKITLAGGMELTSRKEILDYIIETKYSLRDKLFDDAMNGVPKKGADVSKGFSTDMMAKMLNVKRSFLEGDINTVNPMDDMIADFGLTKDQLLSPRTLKMAYNPLNKLPTPEGIIAETHLAQLNTLQQGIHDNVINNWAAGYIGGGAEKLFIGRTPNSTIQEVTSLGGGTSFLTASSGNYGSPVARSEYLGKVTHQLLGKVADKVAASHVAKFDAVVSSGQASLEVLKLQKFIRSSGDHWVLAPGGLVKREVMDSVIERKLNIDDISTFEALDKSSYMKFEHLESADFIKNWVKYNDGHLTQRYTMETAIGYQPKDMRGVLYFPPPNTKKFTHFAFVVDDSIAGGGHTEMIWAKSAEELASLSSQVPTGKGLNVIFPSDTANFYQAHQKYDASLGLTGNPINTSMRRAGTASDFFPSYDINELRDELLDWRLRTEKSLTRDMVAMSESKYFNELYRLGEEHTAIGTATKAAGYLRKYAESDVKNPYINIVKTSLDIQRTSDYPMWNQINNVAEKGFGALIKGVSAIWGSNKHANDKMAEVDAALTKSGMGNPAKDIALSLFENHPAGQGPLTQFVGKMNSILSTLVLRTDPMNAVNNGIGHNVLMWSETRDIINKIAQGDSEAVGKLAMLAVPGAEGKTILSPAKLIAGAYKNYFKIMGNDAESLANREFYKSQGWITDVTEQQRLILDEISLKGTESASKLMAAGTKAGDLFAKISGNNLVEEMNRFVSADVARQITSLAIKGGHMSEKEASLYINTFVNRTNGVFIASQRPLLFSGPLGKAMGLFQTYQFTLLQHVFRHASQGNKAQLAYLAGLQGTLYGMNGLPAFTAINQHLVGNAYGNAEHKDIVSQTFDTVGHEAAQWLLYGVSSNFMLHPDLKTNLYTRGDINPRQPTLVPILPQDIPIVSATARLVKTAMEVGGKLMDGVPAGEAILQGVEHVQLSRPLAGLAVVLQGHSTTEKGNIIAANELFSLTSAVRLLGARPLDEAIARDAWYRVQSYEGAERRKINKLGENIRNKITSKSEVTEEDVNGFMETYVKAGGNQDRFNVYMQTQIKNASTDQISQLMEHTNKPYGRYMQKLMGGSDMYGEEVSE